MTIGSIIQNTRTAPSQYDTGAFGGGFGELAGPKTQVSAVSTGEHEYKTLNT